MVQLERRERLQHHPALSVGQTGRPMDWQGGRQTSGKRGWAQLALWSHLWVGASQVRTGASRAFFCLRTGTPRAHGLGWAEVHPHHLQLAPSRPDVWTNPFTHHT